MKLALVLLAACAGPLAGFTPLVQRIDPRGGQRGSDVELHFHGDRLDEAAEVLCYEPGISVTSLKVENPKHAVATLSIAPDAALGEHTLRLRTPSGIAEAQSFWVGQFPAVAEVEPNESFDQAQRIPLNVTVTGVAGSEDDDYYVCSLKKGQRISVEVEAMRLGRTLFDAYVAILDPRKFEVATCDDCPLLRTDSFVSLIAPEDGDYRIQVREAAYEGNDACQYRLHVGTFPRPSAVFPPGGKPGESVDFTFLGDPSGPIHQVIRLPDSPTARFPVFPTQEGLSAPSPHLITVSPLEHAAETPGATTPLPPLPCAAHGVIDGSPDGDLFSFEAKKGQNLIIRVLARSLRSPLDSVLSVRSMDGATLVTNDDQGSPDSSIAWTVPSDGTFLLHIKDQLNRAGPDFIYRIEILSRSPSLSASLPTVERVQSQKWKTFPVPRGNRYAALINVARENTSCEASMMAENLPPGITMHAPPIAKGMTSFPVVFEAASDAPPAGALSSFTLSATDGSGLTGPLRDTIHYVEVNNEGAYQSVVLDRIATAVITEAPFRIDLETPPVPLVRSGNQALKIRVSRAEAYAGKITVRMLWNPQGVTGPATVDVPGDQSEAVYEASASADAALGEWQLCLLAEGETPQGPVLVASALVPLKVVEPWVSLTLDLAATTQGLATEMIGKAEMLQPFNGSATAELMGLPHGTTCPRQSVAAGATEIHFPIAVAQDATPGKHNGIFCRLEIPSEAGPITHITALNSTLRIDAPAPNAPPPPTAQATTAPAQSRPLSRLEQLRQQNK